jgi:hypothetical protein
MTTAGEVSWPPAGSFLAAYGEVLMAADTVLEQEFQASLVAVTASALALDALYGAAISEQLRRQGPTGRRRVGRVLESLKHAFETGPVNQDWANEFKWLFALRDAGVHPEEKPKPSAQHPLGMNLSPEYVQYSVESAERAVAFALSVLRRCVDFPRSGNQEAAAWADRARSKVDELERLHAKV